MFAPLLSGIRHSLSAIKNNQKSIRNYWINSDFSSRDQIKNRNFDDDNNFQELTSHITWWVDKVRGKNKKIIEIGSGDGRYLNYLQKTLGMGSNLLGSDLMGPRLIEAKKKFTHLTFEEGDAIEILRRHGSENTVFIAANVLGNLTLQELNMLLTLLKKTNASLCFSARGLSKSAKQQSKPRKRFAFDHNYYLLIERHGLKCHRCFFEQNLSNNETGTYILTVSGNTY